MQIFFIACNCIQRGMGRIVEINFRFAIGEAQILQVGRVVTSLLA